MVSGLALVDVECQSYPAGGPTAIAWNLMNTVPLRQVVALVALGAMVGALARAAASFLVPFSPGADSWPWATFTVNIVGCLVMGLFLGRVRVLDRVPPYATPFITTGFLGGLTTFSAFAEDSVLMLEAGDSALAIGYVLSSVVLGLGAVRAGWAMAVRGSG